MLNRTLASQLLDAETAFPLVAMMGPRQSGKTTLAKMTFPDYQTISLENPDYRVFAEQDPRGFLKQYCQAVILDEVQRVPELFSYLQEVVDTSNQPGQYVLTGSHNFLLLEKNHSIFSRTGFFI